MSRRAAAAAPLLTVQYGRIKEWHGCHHTRVVHGHTYMPAPKKMKGFFKAPPYPPTILHLLVYVSAPTMSTAAYTSKLLPPLENDPPTPMPVPRPRTRDFRGPFHLCVPKNSKERQKRKNSRMAKKSSMGFGTALQPDPDMFPVPYPTLGVDIRYGPPMYCGSHSELAALRRHGIYQWQQEQTRTARRHSVSFFGSTGLAPNPVFEHIFSAPFHSGAFLPTFPTINLLIVIQQGWQDGAT